MTVRRFSQTLAPGALSLMLITGSATAGTRDENASMGEPTSEKIVIDFGAGAEAWPNIDDPVMGGLSRSRMTVSGDVAVFEGVVSLENNGGFASLRSRPAEHDLRGFDGIALRLPGDGKTYGVRLRTDSRFDGVSYQTKVATEADRWVEIRLPFETFAPVFRGRRVPGYPALDPARIQTFGLIISDKQEGPFRLEIDWITAFREPRTGS